MVVFYTSHSCVLNIYFYKNDIIAGHISGSCLEILLVASAVAMLVYGFPCHVYKQLVMYEN